MRYIMILALGVLCGGASAGEGALREVLDQVERLTASLDEAQRDLLHVPFNDDNRLTWSYFPVDRRGLPWAEMDDTQREIAHELLRTCLSKAGYEKAESIRVLEGVLREMENSARRDPDRYYLTVFGEPSLEEPWGLRYEGHHLSFNWTMVAGKIVASTPQFLGANPAEVRTGALAGLRALAAEEDIARSLLHSLNEEQRAQAVLSDTAPRDILTTNDREAAIQENLGVSYTDLDREQQGLLLSLIEEYAHVQRPDLAQKRLEALREAGMDTIKFAWMGGLDAGAGHYYRIQGATFLIEYDNVQNNANHIHTVWRDFVGDFGRDILREHYEQHAGTDHGHE